MSNPVSPAPRWLADALRPIAPACRNGRLLLIGPILVAAVLLAVLVFLAPDVRSLTDSFFILTYLANVLPAVAMVVLISLTSRRMAKGMPAAVIGTLIFTVFTVYGLVNMVFNESSTSVLLLIILPFYGAALVIIVGLVTWLVHRVRARGES